MRTARTAVMLAAVVALYALGVPLWLAALAVWGVTLAGEAL